MKYFTQGLGNLAVPSHLFKIICGENRNGRKIACFIVPNTYAPKDPNYTISQFEVSIKDVER